MPEPIILIHGGAGTIRPDQLTPDHRAAIFSGLRRAAEAGQRSLVSGGSALEAVTAAVSALEDDSNFNAGRGAVFTASGTLEMDAAVMDGATSRAGAVAGIVGPRNPIRAARLVMEQTPHVLLAGPAATAFLREQGLPFEDATYFETETRRLALDRFLATGLARDDADRHGTVGAVALDRHGNLAAATSTGGMTGKRSGRIGDTPVFGAGTWADTQCAVSATGHGESFIRLAVAHEVSARLRLARQDLQSAVDDVLATVEQIGGDGGLIALDRTGKAALAFNSQGMYRAQAQGDRPAVAAIYREEFA